MIKKVKNQEDNFEEIYDRSNIFITNFPKFRKTEMDVPLCMHNAHIL